MKLSELKKGDIFKFGIDFWDEENRLHSVEKQSNGKYLIIFIGMDFQGNIETAFGNGSFTWRDKDVEVFIPVYYLSEHKKTKGLPCVPVGQQRHIMPKNLNEINKSNIYCNGNKYHYNRFAIIN